MQRVREALEPSVPGTTIVNDGSIFLVLAVWCVTQLRRAGVPLQQGLKNYMSHRCATEHRDMQYPSWFGHQPLGHDAQHDLGDLTPCPVDCVS